MSMPDAVLVAPIREPYALWQTVRWLRVGASDPTMYLEEHGFVRASWYPEGPATLRVVRRGDVLEMSAWGPAAEAAIRRAPGLVGLDDDAVFLPDHAKIKVALARTPLRRMRSGQVYAALQTLVLQQLITWVEATQIWRRLAMDLGQPAPGPYTLRLPPGPDTLADAPMWRLQRAGLAERRAIVLKGLARRAARLEELTDQDVSEAKARLLSSPGSGPWTVEMAFGLYLGDTDALPTGDAHLPNTLAWFLDGIDRDDDLGMVRRLEPYRPHRFRVVLLAWANAVKEPRRGPKRAPRRG
jgi:3-methyladenine DNA glycosylase/8-oxoguanine DNA glycosylase